MNYIEPTAPRYKDIHLKLENWAEYFETRYLGNQLQFEYSYRYSCRHRNPYLVLHIVWKRTEQECQWSTIIEMSDINFDQAWLKAYAEVKELEENLLAIP